MSAAILTRLWLNTPWPHQVQADAVIHAHDHGHTDTEIIVLLDVG